MEQRPLSSPTSRHDYRCNRPVGRRGANRAPPRQTRLARKRTERTCGSGALRVTRAETVATALLARRIDCPPTDVPPNVPEGENPELRASKA